MKKLFIISAALLAIGFIACSKHRQSRHVCRSCAEMKGEAEGCVKDAGCCVKERAAVAADTVKEKATEVKETVKEKASEAKAAVKEKAAEMKEKAADVLEKGEKKLRE